MALTFGSTACAKARSASWLDTTTKLTAFVRVRFSTISAAKQYVFQHRLGTTNDQFSLRKDDTGNVWKASVTRGGVNVAPAGVSALTADTVYLCLLTYEVGVSGGLTLYVNGSQVAQANTTSQSGSYSTAGGDLFLGARSAGAEFLNGSLEGAIFWAGWIPTADQRGALFKGFWPRQVNAPKPACFYRMWPGSPSQIQDLSGNARHILSADIGGSVSAGATIGIWQPPMALGPGGEYSTTGSAAPQPNAWTLITDDLSEQPPHPNASFLDTGLTNGTVYEYYVTAVDAGGNEGPTSNVVEVTPAAPPPAVSQLYAPWTRQRRWSKWRATQQ